MALCLALAVVHTLHRCDLFRSAYRGVPNMRSAATGFLTRQSSRLPVSDRDLDLPQQIHHLLRLVLLASSHMLSLSSVSLFHWRISSRALHHNAWRKRISAASSLQCRLA
jgi:hypothetical protein